MSAESSLLSEIVDEFLRSYAHGSRLLAVSSPDAERSTAFATALSAAFAERQISTTAVTPNAPDADTLRSRVVAPFRDAGADAVLIVAGDEGLLDATRRGMWHFSVWLLAGSEEPHDDATVLVDVSDPQHPFRRFADSC
ncbi:hypothetical protein [uncultured Microbacterium sp.]|uniref:hypothetical protein n=1 Tax=uncultured Microbacterium sp. TaxID=191216 RepID=UPI0026370C5B|nr:hypothetical protein [uncultured Microbacterium sp.]